MAKIEIKNINLGGNADSNYLGAENSVAESVGLDIHSTPGLIKVNQKLTKDSGVTVTEFCKYGVSCSNGEFYFFSADSGKIWARTSLGVWRLVHTTSAAAGTHTCLGAIEFNGYIYWATQSRLHRITLAGADDTTWSAGLASDWATFTNTDALYHPMHELSLTLYIGDAGILAGVYTDVTPTGAFTANVLDLPLSVRATCLNHIGTDLLIGTFINANTNKGELFRWNTWSPSWTSSDVVPEVGINAFVPIDNGILLSAGTKGNLYAYNGDYLSQVKKIKGDYSGTNKAVVYPGSTLNFNGLPLFAVSNSSANPCLEGIYSFGSSNSNYPTVLNLEYVGSPNVTTAMEYGAMVGSGDTFLVAWKDSTTTPAYGVDLLDVSNKYSGAYFITRMIVIDRDNLKLVGRVNVGYKTIPASTAISISKYVNHGSVTAVASVVNALTHTQQASLDIGNITTLQVKVSMTASSNTAPEIESVLINT